MLSFDCQIHQLQKRSEGNNDHTEIGDIFQVVEVEDEDEEGIADGSKHLGLDNKDIASKSIDLSTTPSKKSPVNRETEEETSDCIEIRDEELDDRNIEQTTTNSGRNLFLCNIITNG